MEQVEIGGLRIAYHRAGSGAPLVLLHGFVGEAGPPGPQLDDSVRRVRGCPGLGCPPRRAIGAAAGLVSHRRLRRLPGGIHSDPPTRSTAPGRAVLRPDRALELFRRRRPSRTRWCSPVLTPVGRLAAAGVADERLRTCLKLAALPPDQFAAAMLSSMFSESAPADSVARFAVSVREFNPAGFRAMTWSSAEADLRDILATVDVPTLLLYGDRDARAQFGRSARPPGRDPGIHIDRLARHRARQSGRGARAVQPQGPRVPPA